MTQTVEEECREHWYGPSWKKPRRNASSKRRWAYDYRSMARLRKTKVNQSLATKK